jgi:hypothetical protein
MTSKAHRNQSKKTRRTTHKKSHYNREVKSQKNASLKRNNLSKNQSKKSVKARKSKYNKRTRSMYKKGGAAFNSSSQNQLDCNEMKMLSQTLRSQRPQFVQSLLESKKDVVVKIVNFQDTGVQLIDSEEARSRIPLLLLDTRQEIFESNDIVLKFIVNIINKVVSVKEKINLNSQAQSAIEHKLKQLMAFRRNSASQLYDQIQKQMNSSANNNNNGKIKSVEGRIFKLELYEEALKLYEIIIILKVALYNEMRNVESTMPDLGSLNKQVMDNLKAMIDQLDAQLSRPSRTNPFAILLSAQKKVINLLKEKQETIGDFLTPSFLIDSLEPIPYAPTQQEESSTKINNIARTIMDEITHDSNSSLIQKLYRYNLEIASNNLMMFEKCSPHQPRLLKRGATTNTTPSKKRGLEENANNAKKPRVVKQVTRSVSAP